MCAVSSTVGTQPAGTSRLKIGGGKASTSNSSDNVSIGRSSGETRPTFDQAHPRAGALRKAGVHWA